MTDPSRRFPAPWRPDRMLGGHVVRDANGQIVGWVYARVSTAEAMQAKVLMLDEARRVATNIARLPELLRSGVIAVSSRGPPCATVARHPQKVNSV